MNILEAIGNAGDLTITGDRKKLKLLEKKTEIIKFIQLI